MMHVVAPKKYLDSVLGIYFHLKLEIHILI